MARKLRASCDKNLIKSLIKKIQSMWGYVTVCHWMLAHKVVNIAYLFPPSCWAMVGSRQRFTMCGASAGYIVDPQWMRCTFKERVLIKTLKICCHYGKH